MWDLSPPTRDRTQVHLQWEHGIFVTGPPGKSLSELFRDPSSIPGSGRSTAERIGSPLQYSWASLVAQLVENPPVMQKTCVQSLGWKDPLEKGKATHSSFLA